MPLTLINTQHSAAVGQESLLRSVFPEWLIAALATAAAQSMRLPQIVKRSISSRSSLGVLCLSSEAACASPSSSLESDGKGCSGSGGGVGGRLAGAAGEAAVGGGGNKSVLGIGWVVTDEEEEEEDDGGLQGLADVLSTLDSPGKKSRTK